MIIDTMIAAYACFNIPKKTEDAIAALQKSRKFHAPDSFRAEFFNVSWQYAKANKIPPAQLEGIVQDGLAIPSTYINSEILWREALALALKYNHSPYDTLFIAAAIKCKSKVLTCDRKLLKTFPKYSIHLSDYIS
ncbi:MAG: type II toxin-antitoxin system VapC family toxin [Planctomycetota bacterium]|jgi:predicted nucleic acid-binding protein